jgi:MYXO-CTERM domain-containing protein
MKPAPKESANLGRCGVSIPLVCLLVLLAGCTASGTPPQPHIDPKMLLLFGLLVLVLVFAWASGNRGERRRREGVSAVAAQMGFAFEAQGALISDWRALRAFRKRPGQKVQNILRSRWRDTEALFFDYEWAEPGGEPGTGGGSGSQSMAVFRVGGRTLPSFHVQPGVLLNRVPAWAGSALGIVTFDSPNPDFGRHYVVGASRGDQAAVRQLFSVGVQSSFAMLDTNHEWSIEGAGEWLVLYRLDRLTQPETYVDFVHKATAIADALSDAMFGKTSQ